MKKFILLIVLPGVLSVYGQGGYFPVAEDQKIQLNKIEILNGRLFSCHTQIRPLNPLNCIVEIMELQKNHPVEDSIDRIQLIKDQVQVLYTNSDSSDTLFHYLINAKGFLSYFYKDGSHFWSVYNDNLQIMLDPLLLMDAGVQDEKLLFINRRGIRLQGSIDQRIYFHSDILETQLNTPSYVHEFIDLYKSFPGASLYKPYKSKFLTSERAYDYLISEAGVGFNVSKHVGISMGHGRHFIGSGNRSLLLSDFATPHFYLKVNTNIWKLHYQNIFSELTDESLGSEGNRLLNKKYMASHYLSFHLTKNWNIGLFESVVFDRKKEFELQYLNPIILYRFVEQSLGSPDNVFLGFHSNMILKKKYNVYAQILFDEFVFKEFFKSNGWWGNKYGFQLGVIAANTFGIKDLQVQLEYNQVRPYTYTFRDTISNYTHFHQSLAHPLGANFHEFNGQINYKPDSRWSLNTRWMYFQKGLDTAGINYGGNVLLDYTTRVSDYGNEITQGNKQKVLSGSLQVSYKLFYRAWLDLQLNFRNSTLDNKTQHDFWISGGFRMNLDRMRFDF